MAPRTSPPDPNRREWLGSLVKRTVAAATELVEEEVERRTVPWLRPPGAVAEPRFLVECTRCDACAEACPADAVLKLSAAAGVAASTPVLKPDLRACLMCSDFPCIAACEDGALLPLPTATWPLGKARVEESRCLPFLGPECGACANTCPEAAPALTLERGRPRIDDETCVGCGLCIEACPTDPAAISFEPLGCTPEDVDTAAETAP